MWHESVRSQCKTRLEVNFPPENPAARIYEWHDANNLVHTDFTCTNNLVHMELA